MRLLLFACGAPSLIIPTEQITSPLCELLPTIGNRLEFPFDRRAERHKRLQTDFFEGRALADSPRQRLDRRA